MGDPRRYDEIMAEAKLTVRQEIKAGLAKLPERCRRKFKLMYARDGGRVGVEDACAMPIGNVVDAMPDDNLAWALVQVDNTIAKVAKDSNPTPRTDSGDSGTETNS